jgi:hypothetical protein
LGFIPEFNFLTGEKKPMGLRANQADIPMAGFLANLLFYWFDVRNK